MRRLCSGIVETSQRSKREGSADFFAVDLFGFLSSFAAVSAHATFSAKAAVSSVYFAYQTFFDVVPAEACDFQSVQNFAGGDCCEFDFDAVFLGILCDSSCHF